LKFLNALAASNDRKFKFTALEGRGTASPDIGRGGRRNASPLRRRKRFFCVI
jgi:hypothetical protein